MGSTGSGSFSDYSGSSSSGKDGGGAGGGSSGADPCAQAFACVLEEVAQCQYYSTRRTVPSPGSAMSLLFRGRIFAVDNTGVVVGALPTRYNYLAACIRNGFHYSGIVSVSQNSPVPSVAADFAPVLP